jgi:hypothetical protein
MNGSMVGTMNEVSRALMSVKLGVDGARVAKMLDHPGCAKTLAAIATVGQVSTLNQKGAMRLVQACDFIASGDMKSLDAGTATILAMVALSESPTIQFEDARFTMGERTANAQFIPGVSRAKVQRFIGSTGTRGTIRSKLSRTVSGRGFLSALGVTVKGDDHSFTITDKARSHPFVLAYVAQLARVTDDAFEFFANK